MSLMDAEIAQGTSWAFRKMNKRVVERVAGPFKQQNGEFASMSPLKQWWCFDIDQTAKTSLFAAMDRYHLVFGAKRTQQ